MSGLAIEEVAWWISKTLLPLSFWILPVQILYTFLHSHPLKSGTKYGAFDVAPLITVFSLHREAD
jgi:hypothetical protein